MNKDPEFQITTRPSETILPEKGTLIVQSRYRLQTWTLNILKGNLGDACLILLHPSERRRSIPDLENIIRR